MDLTTPLWDLLEKPQTTKPKPHSALLRIKPFGKWFSSTSHRAVEKESKLRIHTEVVKDTASTCAAIKLQNV